MNGMVKRTVYDTIPVSVEYELTGSGESFHQVLDVMVEWGLEHRKNIIGKKPRSLFPAIS
jgi:DNA-binding HxlR family transcriptional regulator